MLAIIKKSFIFLYTDLHAFGKMEESLKDRFTAKLETHYGEWDKMASRFGSATFGEISHELSISPSQFSKLIYGTATEGMYQRSIENINRLIEKEAIRQELKAAQMANEQLREQLAQATARPNGQPQKAVITTVSAAVLLTLATVWLIGSLTGKKQNRQPDDNAHPLSAYFDRSFNAKFHSPYLEINEVQAYCPGSAYEGTWSLAKPYKLPLPGLKKPGLYYLAKSADVRVRCSRYDTLEPGKGRVLHAYEYLVNEIWLDTENTPLSPRFFDMEQKEFTPEFESLDFGSSGQFQKVATIHSFFIDRFAIYPDSIVRQGEPCGRYATEINEQLVEAQGIDLKFILQQVLGGLTVTACSASANPFPDPNLLEEGRSILAFDCLYTIEAENLGIGGGYPYTKSYRLESQNYSDNLICH